MEILIITEDYKTESQLIHSVDQIIVEEKLRNLDIVLWNSNVFQFTDSKIIDKHLFLLFDIRNRFNVQKECSILQQHFPYSELGILTETYEQAVTMMNGMSGIKGCVAIEEYEWRTQLRILMRRLDKKEIAMNHGLLWSQNGVSTIIPYEDIDYIETIKGQHYCIVNYDRKQLKIRSIIRELIIMLDDRFVQVKSSVIVNVTKIEVLYHKERRILFRDGMHCYFSTGYEKGLLNQIRSYTVYTKGGDREHGNRQ